MSGSAYRAEWLAEMAHEAETKAEADEYWKAYRQEMISVTGDKNLFRKPPCYTNKPSKSIIRTISPCSCGSKQFKWQRKDFEYPHCNCGSQQANGFNDGYAEYKCSCGKINGKHRVGVWVKFTCPECERETDWHKKNSLARDEWNDTN
jgi:hypothetical protein